MARQVASVMLKNRKGTAVRVTGSVSGDLIGWGLATEPGTGDGIAHLFLAEDGTLHSLRPERMPGSQEDYRWQPFVQDVSLPHPSIGEAVKPSAVSHALVRLLN